MKKNQTTEKRRTNKTSMMVDADLNTEFREICDKKDLMPSKIVRKLLSSWIEKEKKHPKKSIYIANA